MIKITVGLVVVFALFLFFKNLEKIIARFIFNRTLKTIVKHYRNQ